MNIYNRASEGYKTFDIIMNNISMYSNVERFFINIISNSVPFAIVWMGTFSNMLGILGFFVSKKQR